LAGFNVTTEGTRALLRDDRTIRAAKTITADATKYDLTNLFDPKQKGCVIEAPYYRQHTGAA